MSFYGLVAGKHIIFAYLFEDFTAKEKEMKKVCAFFEQENDSDTVDYYRLVGALYPAKEMSKLEKEADQIENEVKNKYSNYRRYYSIL